MNLEAETHHRAKIRAAELRLTLRDYIRVAIEEKNTRRL